ncbi:DNA ligase 1-like [Papilio machaon]|uniref:DNA ligase 1-like n=1 Tax=Papilio machaon TaxID=76193 RepID=UPI001E6639AA|nr:DNA ligase 1-like [Papilio machaon]
MSSSSTDDTANEEKEEKMKRFSKLRHMIRKKRELRQKKKSKKPTQMISMSPSQLRRISNSKTKERPKSLKEHLIEYLKEKKYIEDIKGKIEKKEEQKIEERYLDYNEDKSKVKVKAKEIRDFTQEQERHNRKKKINKKQNIPLSRRPLKKRNKKGIDKNGNILKSNTYNTSSNLVQPKIQPKLDIDHIVNKCANEFKTSIKNIIEEYANSVIEPNSVNNNGIDESTSKESQRHDSTNDEILKPYSDWSTDSDNQSDIMTQEDEDLEIQVSNRKLLKQPLLE